MSFQDIATQIIKESINSVLYIDDKVLMPYEEPQGSLTTPSGLYKSFKDSNCMIDFSRFGLSDIDYSAVLVNKDLLILDWHLKHDITDLNSTFEILLKAINTQNLHFCVIYTDQRESFLAEEVVFNIAARFSGYAKRDNATITQQLSDFISDKVNNDPRLNEIMDLFKKNSKAVVLEIDRERIKVNCEEVIQVIKKELGGIKTFQKFINEDLKIEGANLKAQLAELGYYINNANLPETPLLLNVKIISDQTSLIVNNLYIKVFSKDIEKEHKSLYEEFTTSLTNESNIFLTLLGLEIRNRFRETSGFIGKELDDINHLAFFHHRKHHFSEYEALFNEFLKDIWKDQVSSFLLEKDIKLFDVIDEFKKTRGIDAELEKFLDTNEKDINAIAKLNWVYNRLSINRKENDKIRFGDIFYFEESADNSVYLLCLTPHCDCLRPEKIENSFFFVKGKDIGINNGVKKSDGDFISYIQKQDKNLACIDWTSNLDNDCKPFSLYIANNSMQGEDKTISFNIKGVNKTAKYLCTLKENYAQRISNKAFFYPLRVGIDFASFKSQSKA